MKELTFSNIIAFNIACAPVFDFFLVRMESTKQTKAKQNYFV